MIDMCKGKKWLPLDVWHMENTKIGYKKAPWPASLPISLSFFIFLSFISLSHSPKAKEEEEEKEEEKEEEEREKGHGFEGSFCIEI